MKLSDDGKVMESDDMKEGEYDEHELQCMLENFVKMKEVEKDPAKLAMLKDYAQSKAKDMVSVFDEIGAPKEYKSLADLKKKKDEIDAED